MPETKLLHGTLFLYDTETGERINVAVQAMFGVGELACTIRSLVCEHHPVETVTTDDASAIQVVRELLDRARRVSVPA